MLQKGRKAQPRGRITSSQLEMRRLSFIYIDLPYQMASKLYLLEWEIIEYDKWKMLKLIDLPFKCRLPTTKLQPSLFVSPFIFLSFYTSTYQQKRLYFFHHKIVFVDTTCQSMSFLEKKNKKKYIYCVYAHAYSWRGSNPRCWFFYIENC